MGTKSLFIDIGTNQANINIATSTKSIELFIYYIFQKRFMGAASTIWINIDQHLDN